MNGLFQKAGVEYVPGPPQIMGPDPQFSDHPWLSPDNDNTKPNQVRRARLLLKWAQNDNRGKSSWAPRPNHKVVCGAQTTEESYFGSNNGLTALTWVYNKRIADYVATYYRKTQGIDLAAVAQVAQAEVTAHEFTHHFRTNPAPAADWHCAGEDKVMEDRPDKFCIQNTSQLNQKDPKQYWDGIVGWHKSTPGAVGEAETTRKTSEPVAQGIEPEYFAFQKF